MYKKRKISYKIKKKIYTSPSIIPKSIYPIQIINVATQVIYSNNYSRLQASYSIHFIRKVIYHTVRVFHLKASHFTEYRFGDFVSWILGYLKGNEVHRGNLFEI